MAMLGDILRFDHLGLAVHDFDHAAEFYKQMGYELSDPVHDSAQMVEIIMCSHVSMPNIELIKPIPGKESPVNNILKKNNEIFYHCCYSVNSIDIAITELKKKFRVINISRKKEAILFDNRKVAFFYLAGVGVLELLENPIGD